MKYIDEDLDKPIFHLTRGDLSQHNEDVLEQILSNRDFELSNQLLAQAYLFINTYKIDCLRFNKIQFQFSCPYCKGCEGCQSDDGYCSKYCMHGNDCELAKFIETLEKSFKEPNLKEYKL